MSNKLRNPKKITMDYIASELNISKTTISRAISGKGRVGKETREKVLNFIESLGYVPNSISNRFLKGQTFNIGVVIPDTIDGGDSSFFKTALVGITEASVKRDYDTVLVVVSADDMSGLERLVVNKKVDGLVLTRSDNNKKIIEYLEKNNVPFIVIGKDSRPQVLQIDSNQKEGCKKLVLHLMQKGAKAVSYLSGPSSRSIEKHRYEGFLEAFKEFGVEVNSSLIYWNCSSEIDAIVDDILEKQTDCIVCSDDTICRRVFDLLAKKKIPVPAKIQVVSFFDSVELEKKNITALYVDARELSFKAANLLIDLISGVQVQKSNLVDCSIIYRNSSL